jgi:hypothetical protein
MRFSTLGFSLNQFYLLPHASEYTIRTVSNVFEYSILFHRFVAIGGKFAAGVIETGGNLPPVLFTLVENLPLVSTTPAVPAAKLSRVLLIPVVHLVLQYLRKFSKKFEMTLMLFSGGWGKRIHKKPEIKNLVTLYL